MSDKLKIMQVPLTRSAARMLGDEFAIFYFSTIEGKNYFLEVHLHEGLTRAIARLKEVFDIDASAFCEKTARPIVNRIEVVALDAVPLIDEENLVSLFFPRSS